MTLLYQAIVRAPAPALVRRATGRRSTRQVQLNARITAGPAIATVEVTTEVFTMLQALVGRVFEDVDGNGMFGDGDRPLANARVITSTGQAALTDAGRACTTSRRLAPGRSRSRSIATRCPRD